MLTRFEQQLKNAIDHASTSNPTSTSTSNPSTVPDPMRSRPIDVSDRVIYAELSHAIVGAAIEVHRHIGPGQLESVYQRALEQELGFRELPYRALVPIAMLYKGCSVGEFFADFIVDDKIIVELKAVTGFAAVHKAQVLSYLRATDLRLGMLINFNVPVLWRGVHRLVR